MSIRAKVHAPGSSHASLVGESPPEGVRVGDGVAGRALLGVDAFTYFESLGREPECPPSVHTWDVVRIRRETAPDVSDDTGKAAVRHESERSLVEVVATDAWADDDGHAEYVLDCRLVDVLPRRTSATAT